jgi:TonB family protein
MIPLCCESPLFQSITPPKTPWTRCAASLGAHLAMIALMLAIPLGVRQAIESHQMVLPVQLVAPRLTPPPVKPVNRNRTLSAATQKPRKVKLAVHIEMARVKPPAPRIARIDSPKIEPQKIELPKIEMPKIEAASAPSPKPDSPAPVAKPAVKTGIFAENQPAQPAGRQASRAIRTGGFGDPNGVRPAETSTGKGLMAARMGAFDLPSGSAAGRGGAGTPRATASAGFGDAGTGGGSQAGAGRGGSGNGHVRSSGFGEYQIAPASAHVAAATAPVATPVEIISKPKPVYTPEARQRGIEGEVQLDVLFRATGQVQVLRVIRGLGLGLDSAASTAASQIRFRPGTRDGYPADMRGIVHIVFELS